MPFENTESISLTASAAIAQYRFVSVGANGRIAQSGAGVDPHAVSAEAATAAGQVINVFELSGKVEVEAGAAVTAGVEVASDATGRAVAATSGNEVGGVALESASAAGERITVLMSKRSGPAA